MRRRQGHESEAGTFQEEIDSPTDNGFMKLQDLLKLPWNASYCCQETT